MIKYVFFAVYLFLLVSAELGSEQQFKEFIKKYNKTYETKEEYEKRFQIFQVKIPSCLIDKENMRIASLLSKKEKPNGARFGMTKFSDISREEFASTMLNYRPSVETTATNKAEQNFQNNIVPNPTTWNW